MSLRSFVRGFVRGVSWKNPVVSFGIHAIDPVDFLARGLSGRAHLPPYSIRARSVGINGDIGAKQFVQVGQHMATLLRNHADLTPDSSVLEIGCGCGRNAFALADCLHDGSYVGMDIERVALEKARSNRMLQFKSFKFEFLDVRNDAYNPDGRFLATDYVLPYPDRSFDIVFMVSVFTHMLTDEVRNYTKQISRVLRPGGRCLFTTFLLDGRAGNEFPFHSQEHSYSNEAVPGIAVAYALAFFTQTFAANAMRLTAGPLWGNANKASGVRRPASGVRRPASGVRGQDTVVFTK